MAAPLRLIPSPIPEASSVRRPFTSLPRTERLYGIEQDGPIELLVSCEGLAKNYKSDAGYRLVVDFVYARKDESSPPELQPRFSKYKNVFDEEGHWAFTDVPLDLTRESGRALVARFLKDIEIAARANPKITALLERHPELKL